MKEHALSNDIYKVLAAPSYKYDISMYDADGNGTISPFNTKWCYVNPVSFMIQTSKFP